MTGDEKGRRAEDGAPIGAVEGVKAGQFVQNGAASSPVEASSSGSVDVKLASARGKQVADVGASYASAVDEPSSENSERRDFVPPAGVVRLVSSGHGAGKMKRSLKRGHAPPGAIEEDACDLIRDDFWDRNPHILAGVVRR